MAAVRRRRLLCVTDRALRRRGTALLIVGAACALLAGRGIAEELSAAPAARSLDASGLDAARRQAVAPAAVTGEVSAQALGDRRERVRARYETWLSTREAGAHLHEIPEVPAEAGFPPLPDAPDGEITNESEGEAR